MNNIWFKQSTDDWEEALPIGNGRLGAMIYGQVNEETIHLNEDSLWYGGNKDVHNKDALVYLPQIRELLFEGNVDKANLLAKVAMTSTPKYINPYHPLGYLTFSFQHKEYTDYKRKLDIDNAIVNISYKSEDTLYEREFLSSFPQQVIAMHFKSTGNKKINFIVNINRRPLEATSCKVDNNTIMIDGQSGADGVKFCCALTAKSTDGIIKTIGDFIIVEEASEVELYLSAQTTFRHENYKQITLQQLKEAVSKGYKKIKQEHIKDYQFIYSKNSLKLTENPKNIPTDELIEICRQTQEAVQLSELFYNFGKYLLIASSRKDTLPSNLQGIWNNSYKPAWESNYTININTQMNYWPSDVCNLEDCFEPLVKFIERLCENGKETAKKIYGCNGAVAHHASNIWAQTAPEGILGASPCWPMGLAWLSIHLMEHYRYTLDRNFLEQKVYPVLKEVSRFLCDYLTMSPEGYLVTGPSLSPENTYILPTGETSAICMGPSMDTQIITEIFNSMIYISDSKLLENEDKILIQEIKSKIELLPKIKIGKHNQIMEWYKDYDELEMGHRHISHLFALHPSNQITHSKTPELIEASKVTLSRRLQNGGGHTGWSKVWIVNFYARLFDGEKAYTNLKELFQKLVRINLFNVHPPFQIDGNFGGTAGIAEMLIQSHEEFIRLLPSMPKQWDKGEAKGFCARGGFVLDFKWANERVEFINIYSKAGQTCRIEAPWIKNIKTDNINIEYIVKKDFIEFDTEKGKSYVLK